MAEYTPSERAAITRALNIIAEKGPDDRVMFTSPPLTAQHLRLEMERQDTTREHFMVAFLNAQHSLIECEVLFSGTIDGSAVYPRVIAKAALLNDAAALVLCHNHPSGVLTPSTADRTITARIKDALNLINVRVLDHIIISDGIDYYSFAEKGEI